MGVPSLVLSLGSEIGSGFGLGCRVRSCSGGVRNEVGICVHVHATSCSLQVLSEEKVIIQGTYGDYVPLFPTTNK